MYANDDIYSGPNDPTNKINPKIVGAFYINTKTAKLFVCTNNTINNNTWKMCNPDVKIPEIPPPTPMLFTTCNAYTMNNGPYKNNVIYTNNYNKPICIIVTGSPSNLAIYINGIVLRGNIGTRGATITAIIIPGDQYSISYGGYPDSIHYFVIK